MIALAAAAGDLPAAEPGGPEEAGKGLPLVEEWGGGALIDTRNRFSFRFFGRTKGITSY